MPSCTRECSGIHVYYIRTRTHAPKATHALVTICALCTSKCKSQLSDRFKHKRKSAENAPWPAHHIIFTVLLLLLLLLLLLHSH